MVWPAAGIRGSRVEIYVGAWKLVQLTRFDEILENIILTFRLGGDQFRYPRSRLLVSK